MTEQLKEGLAQLGLHRRKAPWHRWPVRRTAPGAKQGDESHRHQEPAQVAALHFLDRSPCWAPFAEPERKSWWTWAPAQFSAWCSSSWSRLRLTLVASLGKRLDWLGRCAGTRTGGGGAPSRPRRELPSSRAGGTL